MESFIFVITASSLIIFAAFFVRALTGFGSALISIPLLAFLFDLRFAVPLEALIEVGLSILLIGKVYKMISHSTLVPLVIGTIAGSVLGTYVLYSFSNVLLKRVLGLIIILFAANLLLGRDKDGERSLHPKWGLAAGAFGGLFGGLFGTSGPPYVMYLAYKLREKDVLRASLIGLFAIDNTWRVGVFTFSGLLTIETVQFALYLIPALVLGTILGHKMHFQINEQRFRQVVAAVLTISGLLLLVQ